ncbi:hypothetical protein PMZ80_009726 [Knufia obscura]|uniref:Putative gamma-glutamylcyclotransferase n=2 Tax=Knufia TaxID=430999 RepID=A0AAN8EFR8_9EURO|nr:hypothetical protein PMZ80_009726 [Knufia obscura]KAK5949707.1 hypothetical protein OHC33_009304 [Knufia fluminis]
MGEHTAFFYGTLMAPPVLHRVIYGTTTPEPWQSSLTTVRPALLQGYTRHKVKHADYPAILPHSTTPPEKEPSTPLPSVRGTLVTGLTDGDIWRLDIFEGDQYTRQKVRVQILKDTALDEVVDEKDLEAHVQGEAEAETYIWTSPRGELESEEWDFEMFKREKMWAWVGQARSDGVEVDEGFGDVDRAVREGSRDPTGGRGAGGRITRELERAAV